MLPIEQKTSYWFFGHRWVLIAALILIFGTATGIRLYDLTDLPLDFAPTRQLFSVLKARSMYYASLPASADIPIWQREVAARQMTPLIEPPVMETLVALTYRITGEHLWIARIYSALFWVLAGIFLFLLARELASSEAAVISLLFYLFLPHGVIASRSFQPDPLMTALIVAGAWGLYRWHSTRTWGWAVVAGLLMGAAIFVKNMAVFPLGMAALALVLEHGWRDSLKNAQTWGVALMGLLPVMIYTLYGVYIAGFLGKQFGMRFFPELWSTGGFYLRWLGQITEIVSFGTIAMAIVGIFVAERRGMALLAGLWLGYLTFGMTFAYFVASHEYYNLMLVPLVALSLAPVVDLFIKRAQSLRIGSISRAVLSLLIVLVVAIQIWNVRVELVRENWRSDPEFWTMLGEKLGHNSGKVLALSQDYGGRLAYWGWQDVESWYYSGDLELRTLDDRSINLLQRFLDAARGKQYFVVTQVNKLDAQPVIKDYVYQHYPVFSEGQGYIIFDLAHPKAP